ncbi:MAG: hypothetical protein ACYTG1_13425 [Planctomycetota bacterium]|jgi:hypothetical protein
MAPTDPQTNEDPAGGGAAAGRIVGGCLALAAFAVAILSGLASGNEAASVLVRAVVAMIACYPVGMVLGLVAGRVIEEHALADREPTDGRERGEDDAVAAAVEVAAGEEAEEVLVV